MENNNFFLLKDLIFKKGKCIRSDLYFNIALKILGVVGDWCAVSP